MVFIKVATSPPLGPSDGEGSPRGGWFPLGISPDGEERPDHEGRSALCLIKDVTRRLLDQGQE